MLHALKFIHYKIIHKIKCYTYCAAYIVNLFWSQKTSRIFLFESPPVRIKLKRIASKRKTRFCKTSNDVSSRDFPVPVSGQCSRRIFRDDDAWEATLRANNSSTHFSRSWFTVGPCFEHGADNGAYSLGDREAAQWRIEVHGDGSTNYSEKRNILFSNMREWWELKKKKKRKEIHYKKYNFILLKSTNII